MENKVRKTNTVGDIKKAFVNLINEKGIRDINVTDITRMAGIGRGTFYTHFTDINDLLENIESELMDKLETDLSDVIPDAMQWLIVEKGAGVPAPFIIETLNNFYQNREMIAALLSEQGDPYFLNKVKKIIFADLDQSVNRLDEQIEVNDDIPLDYAREFVIDELMGIIVYWISKPEPEKPRVVAQTIAKLQHKAPINVFTKQKGKLDHE
ncbi:TetR/AcrR family transcriptional regulator [Fructilactobacillus sanfranciscensis]|uniref:TetR/AcrR family transcriptional regulator n=1 Tax=Fructilactobacillus sanfranciscensis TaxID=1625 RepID=UPI0013D88E10|nr:TetR/AcrR family transcriptional regulator [Fructilactobacillus sanfranciscensis]NDR77588.1 TetR/AcrR family transcriptional regulator [Fructilactobacillus sanfranciscensis]WED57302.1 TetR/AcrR family transcriptional regulator [Fructilactobacillus sanfranciscensis]